MSPKVKRELRYLAYRWRALTRELTWCKREMATLAARTTELLLSSGSYELAKRLSVVDPREMSACIVAAVETDDQFDRLMVRAGFEDAEAAGL